MNKPHIYSSLHLRSQRGVAALLVILILLFSISGMTLYAANTGLLEQKVSTNDYRAKQLAEAADAGINYAQAWMAQNTNEITWDPNPAPPGTEYQTSTNTVSTSMANGFAANIVFTRAVTLPDHVLITSTATETGGSLVTAVAKLGVVQKKLLVGPPNSPVVVNGCVSGVTGNPDISNTSGSTEIVSSQNSACVDQGHFNGPTGFDVEGEAFVGSAWDRTFGVSMADMQALAAVPGSGVYWVTDTANYHTDTGSLGPPAVPAIVIMSGCAKINAGTTIVGVVYYPTSCETNGWGGGNIYGTVIVDGNLEDMNANTELIYDEDYMAALVGGYVGVKGRIPGSWIDQ